MPETTGWLWGSTNPGISTVAPRSRTSAPGAAARHVSSEPTAAMTPVAGSKAMAEARGDAGSMVMMDDAVRITGADEGVPALVMTAPCRVPSAGGARVGSTLPTGIDGGCDHLDRRRPGQAPGGGAPGPQNAVQVAHSPGRVPRPSWCSGQSAGGSPSGLTPTSAP